MTSIVNRIALAFYKMMPDGGMFYTWNWPFEIHGIKQLFWMTDGRVASMVFNYKYLALYLRVCGDLNECYPTRLLVRLPGKRWETRDYCREFIEIEGTKLTIHWEQINFDSRGKWLGWSFKCVEERMKQPFYKWWNFGLFFTVPNMFDFAFHNNSWHGIIMVYHRHHYFPDGKRGYKWLVSEVRKITLADLVSLLKRKLNARQMLKFDRLFTKAFRQSKG